MPDILSLTKPLKPVPLVFDSPHSGIVYPSDFHYACTALDLGKTEDRYVDDLFSCAPQYGAFFLKALFPRSYIDVNRAESDMDLNLVAGDWPYGPVEPSVRTDAGIGLIRRLARPGVPVYDRALSPVEILARIECYYRPYHKALEDALNQTYYNFGQFWHINCHSMPAASALPKNAIGLAGHQPRAADFVLGDRDGTTCARDFTQTIRKFLQGLGYQVTLNDPFKGVEIVRRYSNPARGRHCLQIEINKTLYMDEETLQKNKNYGALKVDIEKMVEFAAGYAQSQTVNLAAD